MNRKTRSYLCQLAAAAIAIAALQASTGAALPSDARYGQAEHFERPLMLPSRQVLSAARTLYIRSETEFMTASKLEQALQSRKEFDQLGLTLTRFESDADLLIEVHRSAFTTHFNYAILEPGTGRVLTSGAVNSLFGTASGKIASQLVKKLGDARKLSRH